MRGWEALNSEMLVFPWFYKGLAPPWTGDHVDLAVLRYRLTESALGVLKLCTAPTGIYYYEVVSPRSVGAGDVAVDGKRLGRLGVA